MRSLPETILPSRSNGCPASALPCSVRRLNHAIQSSVTFCSSSAESPLRRSVARNSSIHPLSFGVLIGVLGCCLSVGDFLCFNNTTNELPAVGQLFRVWVALPDTARI